MTTIASEYAAALFELAAEENVKNDVADSLKAVKESILREPSYVDLLATPGISTEEREGIIDEAYGKYIHEYAVSFVKLLCVRGHIRVLLECVDEFLRLYEESDGMICADVISAVPLSENEKSKLQKKLEAKLSRRVELVCSVDKSILGGVIVRADGKVMDGSLRTRLADMGSLIGGS